MSAEQPAVRPYRGAGELPAAAYREIVDTSGAAFLVVARDGAITYAGGSVRDVLGWDPAEVVGRNMAEFLPADQIPLAIEALGEVEALSGRPDGVPIVFSIRRADGELGAVEIGGVVLPDSAGVDGTVIRLRDWTAQQHLDEFFAALVAEEPLDVMLASLVRSIAASMNAPAAAVLHGFESGRFAAATAWGVPVDLLTLERGPWCTAARTGEPLDTNARELVPAPPVRLGLTSCWVRPVEIGDDTSAAIVVFHTHAGPPLVGHRRVLDRLARYVRLAMTRSVEHDRLRELAGTDPLTGAMNRAAFRERLAAVLAEDEPGVTVAFCDLDGFKPVNDSHGHRAGDAVLIEVVERLRAAVRRADVLARFGGDEFTVLFRHGDGEPAARIAGQRLLDAMTEPYAVGDSTVQLGLSIGLVTSRPGDTADQLLGRADAALYDAKRAGGGCMRVRT
jgi:diguanylate cyclase (GGDEF)-like protein/PAS domain S-box-containing protein